MKVAALGRHKECLKHIDQKPGDEGWGDGYLNNVNISNSSKHTGIYNNRFII